MQELECKNKQGNPPQLGGFGLFFLKSIDFLSKNLINFIKTGGKYLNLGLLVFDTRINYLKESVEN